MNKFLSLLVLLLFSHLFADDIDLPEGYTLATFEEESAISSVADKGTPPTENLKATQMLEALPSGIVADCVNIVTGRYIESHVDLVTPGPVPLLVQRSWSSKEHKWHFAHQPLLQVGIGKKGYVEAGFRGDLGSGITYREDAFGITRDYLSMCPKSSCFKKGTTNCGSGEISGQTNWKNTYLLFVKYNHKKRYLLGHASKTKRVFSLKKKTGSERGVLFGDFKLREEYHPNGNYLVYEYGKYSPDKLKKIEAYNSKHESLVQLYHLWASWEKVRTWQSFAGRVKYTFYDDKLKRILSARASNGILVGYNYDKKGRIVNRIYPNYRGLVIDYHKDGKVKALKSRVGLDKKLYRTHRFSYSKGKHWLRANVYDAKGNCTSYYSSKGRLRSVSRYQGNTWLSRENYSWTPEGNLLSHTFNGVGLCKFEKTLQYDRRGNITEETLKGNLTGKAYDESYTKTFLISQDRWDLPLEERTDRKWVRFRYYSKKNQLKARFTGSEETIHKREFFKYDINGTLIEEILDDGSSENVDDLTHVTERHIKKITPTATYPIGLPAVVEEFCLDLETGASIPLKTTTYLYFDQGLPLEETHHDSQGNKIYTLIKEYNSLGLITKETDAAGNSATYTYDSNGNKISEEREHLTKYFTYDYADRMIKEEEVWPDGTQLITTHRYNKLSQKVATIDWYGNETTYVYDALGYLTETHYPPISTQANIKDPVAYTSYDAMGNPLESVDPHGFKTVKTYTSYGKVSSITYPDQSIERKEYTLDGLLCKEIAKNGRVTTYHHDFLGRVTHTQVFDKEENLLKSTSSTYNTFHLLSETDEEGIKTDYAYDPAGRLKKVTHLDKLIEYRYDPQGRRTHTIEWADQKTARVTIQEFDSLDRVVEERIEDLEGNLFKKQKFAYDSAGNRTHVITDTSVQMTTYTPQGKPLLEVDAEGNETHYHYTFGKLLEVCRVDPLGNQQVQVIDYRGKGIEQRNLNALGELIHLQIDDYDACSRLISSTATIYQGTTPLDTYRVNWIYNCMGHQISCTEAPGTSLAKTTSYSYDLSGNKITTVTPNQVTLHQEYDILGRRTRSYSSDATIDYLYHYDLKDRPVHVEDQVQGTQNHRTYNAYGYLEQETLDNGLTMSYAHDHRGRITAVTLPDGTEIHYQYNAHQLTNVSRIKNGGVQYAHAYLGYDSYSQPLLEQLPADLGQRVTKRDRLHRPIQVEAPHYFETISYDAAGNLTARQAADQRSEYRYDALYQLIEESGTYAHTYTNDSLWNRREKDGNAYDVNVLNQLTSESTHTYAYDPNGCLTQRDQAEYIYDALNRLIEVRASEGMTQYTYDAYHRRMSKAHDGVTERYVFQDQCEIGTVVNDTLMQLRVLGKGIVAEIGAAIAIELVDEVYVPLHDTTGNVVKLLSLNGEEVQCYHYSAFGEEEYSAADWDTPWKFSSKRFDPETGFYHFGRRYYLPEVGRWITPDPAGFEDGLNMYAYVHNSPLIYVDPDGQWAFLVPLLVNVAISVTTDYLLPVAVASLQQYAGGAVVAASLSGVVNGYNGNYTSGTFGLDPTLGFCEKAGMALGTALAYNPAKLGSRAVTKIAQSEITGTVVNKFLLKGSQSVKFFARNTAVNSTKKVAKTTVEKTTEQAVRKQLTPTVTSSVKNTVKQGARNRFSPDVNASGAHSVFRKNPINGKTDKYQTYWLQTNRKNPNKWEFGVRFDGVGSPHNHYNKITGKRLYTPHVHDPRAPGSIRLPEFLEIP